MTRLLFNSSLVLSCLLLVSCGEKPKTRNNTQNVLFSLDSLFQGQVREMKGRSLGVSRISEINGRQDSVYFRPDTAFWRKEFSVITAADIGKPSLYDRYRKSETDSSGRKSMIYTALDPKINGTSYMSVSRDDSGNIFRIQIHEQEKGLIYRSSRIIVLDFRNDPGRRTVLLSRYSIRGTQKIFLRKKVNYRIRVIINPLNS